MPDWVVALVPVALVAGVVGFSVLSASAAVESRVLVVGFLLFFAFGLAAGAGFLPTSPIEDETMGQFHSASLTKAQGDSR
jgi:hypothetical protein